MAFTQAQLDALDEAIATGSLEVRYGDKTVKYRALDEMLRIRDAIRESVDGTGASNRVTYATFSKG
jgi:hypothetical protein